MIRFLMQRTALAVITVVAVSIISFVIIQLPEGDFVDGYIEQIFGEYDSHFSSGEFRGRHREAAAQ